MNAVLKAQRATSVASFKSRDAAERFPSMRDSSVGLTSASSCDIHPLLHFAQMDLTVKLLRS